MASANDSVVSVVASMIIYPIILLNLPLVALIIIRQFSEVFYIFAYNLISAIPYVGKVFAFIIKYLTGILMLLITILLFYFYTWHYLIQQF